LKTAQHGLGTENTNWWEKLAVCELIKGYEREETSVQLQNLLILRYSSTIVWSTLYRHSEHMYSSNSKLWQYCKTSSRSS